MATTPQLPYAFDEPVLTSLVAAEEWRQQQQGTGDEVYPWSRPGGSILDVYNDDDNNSTSATSSSTDEPRALCHMVILDSLTTTSNKNNDTSILRTAPDSTSDYQQAAAVALALHHLNTANGRLVPELSGVSSCPIRFTMEFINTATSDDAGERAAGISLREVANVTSRTTTSTTTQHLPPCAFLGAGSSSVSIPSSILTGNRDFVQISPTSTSSELDDKELFPLFGRTIPSDEYNAKIYLQFFHQVLGLNHLTIVHSRTGTSDAYGSALVENILQLASTVEFSNLDIFDIAVHADQPWSIQTTIARVRARQYRYIWCMVFPSTNVHDALMTEAVRQGVAAGNGDYNWFFADTFHKILFGRAFEEGSILAQAYRGVGCLEVTGAVAGMSKLELLQEDLQRLDNVQDLELLESVLPSPPNHEEELHWTIVNGSSNMGYTVFAYEAAIAIGLAACQAVDDDMYLSGMQHFAQLRQTTFTGISGEMVSFNATTGSRNPANTFYRVRNYLAEAGGNGRVYFRDVTTHVYQNGTWDQWGDYTFNDGSTTILPDIPPQDIDQQLISPWVRTILLVLCALIFCQALGFMYWTNRHKKSRVVLASQPFFLHTICIGIMIFGSSMIPMTLDHGVMNIKGCQRACTSTVWLLALGFATTMSAFVAKTHRVNRILNNPNKFKRIKVTVRQVAAPMVISMSVNIILLTVMTIWANPEYDLDVEERDEFGRASQMQGRCDWEESMPYMSALLVFNVIVLAIAGWESYKARKLSMEFSESRYVFRALLSTLSVTFVGLPLLFLAQANPSALAFVTGSIVFVASSSILLLMFVPKIKYFNRLTNGNLGSTQSFRNKFTVAAGPRNRISGLEDSTSGERPSRISTYSGTSPLPQEGQDSRTTADSSSSENITRGLSRSKQFKGMQILTLKKKSQLLRENEVLGEVLEEIQHLIDTSEDIDALRANIVAIGPLSDLVATTRNGAPPAPPAATPCVAALAEPFSEE